MDIWNWGSNLAEEGRTEPTLAAGRRFGGPLVPDLLLIERTFHTAPAVVENVGVVVQCPCPLQLPFERFDQRSRQHRDAILPALAVADGDFAPFEVRSLTLRRTHSISRSPDP